MPDEIIHEEEGPLSAAKTTQHRLIYQNSMGLPPMKQSPVKNSNRKFGKTFSLQIESPLKNAFRGNGTGTSLSRGASRTSTGLML